MVGLFFSFVFVIGRRDEDAAYPPLEPAAVSLHQMSSLSVFGRRKKNRVEASRSKCTKKNVHPVFEKLEFYLNLKNDFALTFIRDERRVYFFSKKKVPKR